MLAFENRHVRRFVLRIERGEDVVASLKRFAENERIRAAWIRGTGVCEWVELTEWDAARGCLRSPRLVQGPLTLLSCEGNVSMRLGEPYVELRAALSREGDVGLAIVGGQVAIAASLNVEMLVEVLEDVRLERNEDGETGLAVWKGDRIHGVVARPSERVGERRNERMSTGTSRRSSPQVGESYAEMQRSKPPATNPKVERTGAEASSNVGWQDVVCASEAADSSSDEGRTRLRHFVFEVGANEQRAPSAADAEPTPKKGDWIEHRQFGLCRVDGVDVEGGLLVRLPSGTRKTIHLETLEVLSPRFEGERRIFPLRPRLRR